jgi:hypothetical protein
MMAPPTSSIDRIIRYQSVIAQNENFHEWACDPMPQTFTHAENDDNNRLPSVAAGTGKSARR